MREGPRFLDAGTSSPAAPATLSPASSAPQATPPAVEAAATRQAPSFLDAPPAPAPEEPTAQPDRRSPGWLEPAGQREGPIVHDHAEAITPEVPVGSGALLQGAVALLLLVCGVAVLQLANFVEAQFARAFWLGILTLVALVPFLGFIVWSTYREWRGYAVLGEVEHRRRAMAGSDKAVVQAAAAAWLESAGLRPLDAAITSVAKDAEIIRGLLRAGPLVELDRRTAEAGRTAAFQVLAATAVSPWPGLDGLIVVWRGMRLVREVAQIHGVRPGTAGTIRLFRHVTMDAGSVAAADIAVTAVTEAVFNSPMAGAIAGQATGAAIAARRVLRLSYAVAKACRPL